MNIDFKTKIGESYKNYKEKSIKKDEKDFILDFSRDYKKHIDELKETKIEPIQGKLSKETLQKLVYTPEGEPIIFEAPKFSLKEAMSYAAKNPGKVLKDAVQKYANGIGKAWNYSASVSKSLIDSLLTPLFEDKDKEYLLSERQKEREYRTDIKRELDFEEVAGFYAGQMMINSIATRVIGAEVGRVAPFIPIAGKYLPMVEQAAQNHPWLVGYPTEVIKAGLVGAIRGFIEDVETKEERVANIKRNAVTYAIFMAIAYPITTFFRDTMRKIGESSGTIKDPKTEEMIKSPEQEYVTFEEPKAAYFRSPKNPRMIMKVTAQGVYLLTPEEATEVLKGTKDSIPVLYNTEIETFKYEPSLYKQLKAFLRGEAIDDFIFREFQEERMAAAEAAKQAKEAQRIFVDAVDVTQSESASVSPEGVSVSLEIIPTDASENIRQFRDIIPPTDISITDIPEPKIISEANTISEKEVPIRRDLSKIQDNDVNIIIKDNPNIYTDRVLSLEDRSPEEVAKWNNKIKDYEISKKELDKIKPKEKTKPVKFLGITKGSSNIYIAHLDTGDEITTEINAEYYKWLTKEGYTIKSTGIPDKPLVLERGGKDVGLLMPIKSDTFKSDESVLVSSFSKPEPIKIEIEMKSPEGEKEVPVRIIESSKEKLDQIKKYNEVSAKVDTGKNITEEDLDILRKGVPYSEGVGKDGKSSKTPRADIVEDKIMEMYSGVPIIKALDNISVVFRGSKVPIIDAIGQLFIKYHGLTDEVKNILTKFENSPSLKREDLKNLFMKEFPLTPKDASLLPSHQEDPLRNPIPEELEYFAEKLEAYMEASKNLQKKYNISKSFFPDSHIARNIDKINKYKEIMPTLKKEGTIAKYIEKIELLEAENKFLGELRYMTRSYLWGDSVQRKGIEKLAKKGFSKIIKSKGFPERKIATLEDAKELGLVPEEDVRILLTEHFDYLFRKIAAKQLIETIKKNSDIAQHVSKAPGDWRRLAMEGLDDYRINPYFINALREFYSSDRGGIWNMASDAYDSVNSLLKTMAFYNMFIMPRINIKQAYFAGSITPWRPIYNAKLLQRALMEVQSEGDIYREAVEGGLYSVKNINTFPSSIRDTMQVAINKLDDEYPKWKKAIESLVGHPVDWKTYTGIPDLYKINNRIVWGSDRIIRTITLLYGLDSGMDMDTAINFANKFHADYDLLTKDSKKLLNKIIFVATYKSNMLFNLPAYAGKNAIKLAKGTYDWAKDKDKDKGFKDYTTPEERAAGTAFFRIALLWAVKALMLGAAGYRFDKKYRWIKKIKAKVSKEGKVFEEQVVVPAGPENELNKLISRLIEQGLGGLRIYMAKIPQIIWGIAANRRWNGEKYYEDWAVGKVKDRQIYTGILKDIFGPIDQYVMFSEDEQDAIYKIMSLFGTSIYERGSTERRLANEIIHYNGRLNSIMTNTKISSKDRKAMIDECLEIINQRVKELDELNAIKYLDENK